MLKYYICPVRLGNGKNFQLQRKQYYCLHWKYYGCMNSLGAMSLEYFTRLAFFKSLLVVLPPPLPPRTLQLFSLVDVWNLNWQELWRAISFFMFHVVLLKFGGKLPCQKCFEQLIATGLYSVQVLQNGANPALVFTRLVQNLYIPMLCKVSCLHYKQGLGGGGEFILNFC